MRFLRRRRRFSEAIQHRINIDTDAAFTDSINLPGFDRDQLEGRVVRPLARSEVFVLVGLLVLFMGAALMKSFSVQILHGSEYKTQSENNRLAYTTIFAERGTILDRYGRKLAWNVPNKESTETEVLFPERAYIDSKAFSHMLGYIEYPKRDASGNWWRDTYEPKGGIEQVADERLKGVNGKYILEVDARGKKASGVMVEPAHSGQDVRVSIDADLNKRLYATIEHGVEQSRFRGGASVILDVRTGEVVAMTSYPSFDLNKFVSKDDKKLLQDYLTSTRSVLMNRALQGAYAPGSIVKPYMAIAALEQGIVTPEWGIVSTGSISIPNPYNPSKPSIFRDWKAHGFVDMRSAIGVSSDVYFYAVGGGYKDQRGMGIAAIDTWGKAFGFSQETGIELPGESAGQIPTPEWKAKAFPDETRWTIGNTYHAAIGQYGWLATPLQAVRYTAAVANYGTLLTPTIFLGQKSSETAVGAKRSSFEVAHDGMRYSATKGTAKSLNIPGFDLAAKTGTAQVGAHNEKMHSWVIGFWPSHNPRFAFVTMYENGHAGTLVGAAPSMRPFFESLIAEHSPYISGEYPTQASVDESEKKKNGSASDTDPELEHALHMLQKSQTDDMTQPNESSVDEADAGLEEHDSVPTDVSDVQAAPL